MSSLLVLGAFAAIVFSPCLVAFNSTWEEGQSPLAGVFASCRTMLRRIL